VQVIMENKKVLFKVDTGAEVAAMSESAWNSLTELRKIKQRLRGPMF